MRLLTVTARSHVSDLVSAVARALRTDEEVMLQATGTSDIQQLLQVVTHIRKQGLAEDLPVVYSIEAGSTDEDGVEEPTARISLAAVHPESSERAVDWSEIEDEINEQFEEWQVMPDEDSPLAQKLREHHSESPILSGGDVDAAWDQADVGEETVGGSTPTPDMDVVDELGLAAGLTYEDEEPLHTGEILEERDRHRWELDPASAEEE